MLSNSLTLNTYINRNLLQFSLLLNIDELNAKSYWNFIKDDRFSNFLKCFTTDDI